jgi:hypothetical protein
VGTGGAGGVAGGVTPAEKVTLTVAPAVPVPEIVGSVLWFAAPLSGDVITGATGLTLLMVKVTVAAALVTPF